MSYMFVLHFLKFLAHEGVKFEMENAKRRFRKVVFHVQPTRVAGRARAPRVVPLAGRVQAAPHS